MLLESQSGLMVKVLNLQETISFNAALGMEAWLLVTLPRYSLSAL